MQVLQPPDGKPSGFGLFRVRSPLLTESLIVFYSSGYLDVSVPRVCLPFGIVPLHGTGLPHSEIYGSKLVCSSPQLIAAYHVLHRLQEPRHSPYALIRFQILDLPTIVSSILFKSSMSMNVQLTPYKIIGTSICSTPMVDTAIEDAYPICRFLQISFKKSSRQEGIGKDEYESHLKWQWTQKGGIPAAPSGTATLLRLSPSHQFYLR